MPLDFPLALSTISQGKTVKHPRWLSILVVLLSSHPTQSNAELKTTPTRIPSSANLETLYQGYSDYSEESLVTSNHTSGCISQSSTLFPLPFRQPASMPFLPTSKPLKPWSWLLSRPPTPSVAGLPRRPRHLRAPAPMALYHGNRLRPSVVGHTVARPADPLVSRISQPRPPKLSLPLPSL